MDRWWQDTYPEYEETLPSGGSFIEEIAFLAIIAAIFFAWRVYKNKDS